MDEFCDDDGDSVPAPATSEGRDLLYNGGPLDSGDPGPPDSGGGDREFDDAFDAQVDGLPGGLTADCSDVRNAERLIGWFGSNLRHVGKWNKWLTWDRTRWAENPKRALAAAVRTSRMMLDEATLQLTDAEATFDLVRTRDVEDPARLEAEEAYAAAKKYYAWAICSQSRAAITAMLDLAAADSSVAVGHDQLDADGMLLNCINGTVDLRTAELVAHRREDLCTMSSPVAYDPDATCPTWDRFVAQAMADSAHMIAYLQRVVGYLISGSVKEHALFFFHGGGANGKSTFTNTILALLGDDLAGPAPRDMLFAGKQEHATREASLYRKRFVLCSEIGEGKRLDEALVKDLTGGDKVTARRMREDFWSFDPTHKIAISGNHKPIITGTDEGIWRRLRFVPWLVTIPKEQRDKDLPAKLLAELPGILAWAVRGCLEWQRQGLADPQAVTDATDGYRLDSDALGEFFQQIVFGPDVPECRVAKARLMGAYKAWCEAEGHAALGARRLTERVRLHAADQGAVITERMQRAPDSPFPVRTWGGMKLLAT